MAKNKQKFTSSMKSRKQIRKEKRNLKKIKRNEYYVNKAKSKSVVFCKDDAVNANEGTCDDDLGKHCEETGTCILDQQMKQKRKEDVQFKKLERKMKAQRLRQLREGNEKDDKMIRSLEKKLRLNRRKSRTLPKSFTAEGLDYLLDVCGYRGRKDALNLERDLCEAGDDFEDDLAIITDSQKKIENKRNNSTKKKVSKLEADDHIYEKSNFSDSIFQKAFDGDDCNTGCDEEIVDAYDDWHSDSEGVQSDGEGISKQIHEVDEDERPKSLKEDIYGRLRDEKGNIVENNDRKYIPPQLREQSSSNIVESDEDLHRLSKQMKGYLNRLTGNNMHSISSLVEDLYMIHSRHDVSFVLLKLFRDSLITTILSPDRIIIEHALLISILHANVGTEIGAYILQHMIEDFNKLVNENLPLEDKRIHNIVVFLCQLYNFKIFNASLIYEVLKKFVYKFQEGDIDLILLVLKNVGFNLRKDNPLLLKELICTIQEKANESSTLRENTRVRFMLETLTAVKNNNMLKLQNYDPSYVDHLKKIQKSLLRQGKYISELNISLDDLLNADTKGRWWIVGSAWTGNLGNKVDTTCGTSMCTFDQNILDLAKKQRMNTDTRKNIFCILMSAEDYVDAFEKLMKLGLKGQQYQEIVYVLMHCILKEKKYNPYYSYIAEQLCSADRKYQLAIQFATWDRFKDIESLNDVQITNLAKFIGYLFLEQKLPLSVLKVLQFAQMNKQMVRLIRQIVLVILLSKDNTVIVDIFSRISKSEKLVILREGLQLFLHRFVLRNIRTSVDGECEKSTQLLRKHVELAINAMRG